MRRDNYCIRPDYAARSRNATIEATTGDYWNDRRIAMAESYQFYVYRFAGEVAAKRLSRPIAVADVGCGYPVKLRLVEPHVDSITLFDQPTLRETARERFPDWRFVETDLERPSPVSERYDLVVCSDVLEHLLDPDPCMEFLAHLGSSRAQYVFSTPDRDVLRGPDCISSPKEEHVREWNVPEFVAYLQTHGFAVEKSIRMPPQKLGDVPRRVEICSAGAVG